ncbi:hypothetical protein J6590_050409 [Homalodisca vitripennis]|nr:hypothetical protein J6590_050409 [Homalodisca vitripennis]
MPEQLVDTPDDSPTGPSGTTMTGTCKCKRPAREVRVPGAAAHNERSEAGRSISLWPLPICTWPVDILQWCQGGGACDCRLGNNIWQLSLSPPHPLTMTKNNN